MLLRGVGVLLGAAAVWTLTALACSNDGAVTAAATTAASGSGGSGASGGAGSGAGDAGGSGGGFVLEVHTELMGDDMLLRTNLPRDVSGCEALSGPTCSDEDADGLTDEWEDIVIDRLRPRVRLDESEQLVGDAGFVTAIVARVAPVDSLIHAYMMLGYAKDYGSCGGFTAHNGDSERVVLALEPLGDAGDVRVSSAYTAAHEGTVSDKGAVYTGSSLSELLYELDAQLGGEPRWVVFASADKHATYANANLCESAAMGIPCVDEDCSPDGVSDPTAYNLLMPYINAGEESVPLVTELSSVGFSGDDAWADQDFCGGLGGNGCSAAVRDKLLVNPF